MPTRQAWLVTATGLAIILAGRTFAVLELFAVGTGVLALVVAANVRTAIRRPQMQVGRQISPSHPSVDEPARVELHITALRSTPALDLWEPVEGVGGAALRIAPQKRDESAVAAYKLPTDRRGVVRIGPTSVEFRDAFGLSKRQLWVAATDEVVVFPRWQLIPLPSLGVGDGPLIQRLRMKMLAQSGAQEFHALRDYVAGDDLRKVHWKQTARRDDLIVRQTDPASKLALTVVFDLQATQYTAAGFERAVSVAASICASAAHEGRIIRYLTTDATDRTIDANHLAETLEHLALIQPSQGRIPPRGRSHYDVLHVVAVICGRPEPARLAVLAQAAGTSDAGLVVACEPDGATPEGWFRVNATQWSQFPSNWQATVGHAVERARPLPTGASA